MRGKGFSLIEVILALGILSVALLIVFGIFTPFLNRTGEVIAYSNVDRVADLVSTQIQSLEYDEVISILNQQVLLFASRSGDTLVSDTDPQLEQKLPEADRHYAISLTRNLDLSPAARDGTAGFVAFQIRIDRLIRAPNGQLLDNQLDTNLGIFNTAVTRVGH